MAIAPRTELSSQELETLASIQRRVLWLATRMIDYANHERPSGDALKVGGHQASSASMVTAMTALYFRWLKAGDRVAVKPHASTTLAKRGAAAPRPTEPVEKSIGSGSFVREG